MGESARIPDNEPQRLERLRDLDVLDSEREPLFDALVRAAARVCGVPIALMTLVDEQRQWFKADVGFGSRTETPRSEAFCAHTILDDAILEVPDASVDERFQDNPLVTGPSDIRFYAGAPIVLRGGLRIGSLCVIDHQPRHLDDQQRATLIDLAAAAAEALEQRVQARERASALAREVGAGERLTAVITATGAGTLEWNVATGAVAVNDSWQRALGTPAATQAVDALAPWLVDVHPDELTQLKQELDTHLRGDSALYDVEARVRRSDGRWVWVRDRARVVERTAAGDPEWMFGTRVDIDARKRAEQAATRAEERMHTLYAETPAMLHSVDPQGRLLEVSDLWLERLGYGREAVIGRAVTDFLTEDSKAQSAINVPQFLHDGRCDRLPYQMVRSDGEVIDVELSSRLDRDAQERPLRSMAVIEDVTARRSAERRLATSESFLERTGKIAGVGGWEVDLETSSVTWSDETCSIHDRPAGYRPTLAEGIEYYAPEAQPVIRAAVEKSFADGSSWDLELPLVTASGRRIWIRTLGSVEFEENRPTRIVGAFQDITYRRRAVQSLEASERRFRKLFEHGLGLICTHDLDGTILSINPAAARSLGYRESQLMGRSLEDFIPEKHRDMFRAYLQRVAAVGTDSGMLQLVAADGRMRLWQYHNMLDDGDDAPYVLGHAQDITARQVQLQQLRDWSVRDALTGAFNRRFLAELSESIGDDDRWGCIAVDLDKFKLVNDTHGHQRGDEVLVEMAEFLQRHLRPDDAVLRIGGDEFLLLLQGADQRTLDRVVERYRDDSGAAPNEFTMGVALRKPGRPLSEAIAAADDLLYAERARVRGPAGTGDARNDGG